MSDNIRGDQSPPQASIIWPFFERHQGSGFVGAAAFGAEPVPLVAVAASVVL